jgi:hypothetical protein
MIVMTFAAAVAGVFVGNRLIPARPTPGAELHAVLHHKLALDSGQRARLATLEQRYAVRRQAMELELRSDNALLAEAIEVEHGYGPKVSTAIDRSHQAMGQLQKETLAHVFMMRQLLQPDQAVTFDSAVTRALTDEER